MSPRKQPSPGTRRRDTGVTARDPRERGLQAFEAGRFDDAIAIWSRLMQVDRTIFSVLAEAHFRRALARTLDEDRLDDLRRAIELRPRDFRYQYHLGLALHRLGDLDGAIERYRAVVGQDPGIPGAGLVLALAHLEQDPLADVAALPGYDAQVHVVLAPVQALLHGAAPLVNGDTPMERLWRGLALIPTGDGSARELMADNRKLPSALAANVRRYYLGVAAAQAGDLDAALEAWQHVRDQYIDTPWLRDNLTAAILQRVSEDNGGDPDRTAEFVHRAAGLAAGNPALAGVLVQALDRNARASAEQGDWVQATVMWRDALDVVRANAGLGSPRAILHNLALAFEAREEWGEAAKMWRAMLRTRARKGGDAGQPSDAQWSWIRKRVVECYKRAGTPGEAVTIFRQAIKAAPDDLDARLQLVDALMANEQEQAAYNEVERILAIDPMHVDARLRGSMLLGLSDEFQLARAMLQPVLEQQSQHEAARRQMVQLLLTEGQRNLQWFDLAAAERAFQEAHRYAPLDWHPLLNLARVAINQKNLGRADEMLTRVLQLAGDQADAYLATIECWVVADHIDNIRATLARAEAALPLTSDFLIEVGLMLLERDRPVSPFAVLGLPQKRKAKPGPRSGLALELLDRAMAVEPENGRMRLALAAQLMRVESELALRYAEEGVQTPAGRSRGIHAACHVAHCGQTRARRKRDTTSRRASGPTTREC